MAEWSLPELDYPINEFNTYPYATYPSCYQENSVQSVPHYPPPQAQPCLPPPPANMDMHFTPQLHYGNSGTVSKGDNPREIRNRAEKMRRDRLNQSVAELATMVPPVLAARRKIDKTTVLRLTAHYLRAHQYVFGDSIGQSVQEFNPASIQKVLSLFNGFLITTTYRGIIVVISQNVHQYLGYTELDLLGHNIFNITHEDDRLLLRDQLMPRSQHLGPNGELIIPDEPDAIQKVEEALAQEKRHFVVRIKKQGQRSEPNKYVTCHVEGSLRKSDRACRGYNRCCQIVRRTRARSENPCSSGNDIVFIGIVRPTSESFINESALESYRMEYRTRHSIDGEIIQCESRIALVTGYLTHEVNGMNAMNFMHRDDVRWVIIALREMYDQHRLFGESCYRLMTKNGQFIYMKTRGRLDVDQDSRAVTSFVCTNTVVNEEEGRHLIRLMRRKFTLLVNNNENPADAEVEEITDEDEICENQPAPVEDPRRLEQVILHLVTNLPSPPAQEQEQEFLASISSENSGSSTHRLTIIPPAKDRIVNAIGKMYGVIQSFHKDPDIAESNFVNNNDRESERQPETTAIIDLEAISPVGKMTPVKNIDDTDYVQAPESPLTQEIPLIESENTYNSESIFNARVSPDMGYFDASPSEYSHISSVFVNLYKNKQENLNEQAAADVEKSPFNLTNSEMSMSLTTFAWQSNQIQVLHQPSTSNPTCGTKRPYDFEDLNIMYKKKNIEVDGQDELIPGCESPIPNDVFDETVTDSQLFSALSILDTFDPSFPDLLDPDDIQKILGKIENEAQIMNEQQIQNYDSCEYE